MNDRRQTQQQEATAPPRTSAATPLVRQGDRGAGSLEEHYSGSFRDPARVNRLLEQAQRNTNLVSPMPAVGRICEGFSIGLSVVLIDRRPMEKGGEVYKVGDKWALAKSALDRISLAAGISWDPYLTRRIDDRSDRRYVEYYAVARVKDFDGRELVLPASRAVDLRPGGADLAKAGPDAPKFILPLAESKAKNRAIRSLGIKTGYTSEELENPFVVAKLMMTGESDDPEIRRMFARASIDRFYGTPTIYGPPVALGAFTSPPPVGARGGGWDDDDDDAPPSPRRDVPPAKPTPQQADDPRPRFRFGKAAGKLFEQGSEADLRWYIGALDQNIADPTKARWREANERDAEAAREELQARTSVVDGNGAPDGADPERT